MLIALVATLSLTAQARTTVRNPYFSRLRDSLQTISAPDSTVLPAPDSAALAAIADSIALAALRDSMDRYFWSQVDTTSLPYLDSMYRAYYDSIMTLLPDSSDIKKAQKRVRKETRDSIKQNTPRILSTSAVAESLYYRRILVWTADTRFNELHMRGLDTLANQNFHDEPMFKKDVNATYLGTVGSPTQYFNFFKRETLDEAPTFTPYIGDSYTPDNLPQFNTKTPYTELAYWGTPFAYQKQEESEVHLLSTQNITPALNFTLAYNRYGSRGMLTREETDNRTTMVYLNYLGKRYIANGGMIRQSVVHNENGGVQETFWIRDTVVEPKSIAVNLTDANSTLKRRTYFIDHNLAIPLNFFRKDADSLAAGEGTMAFIGHYGEFSTYKRTYRDNIAENDAFGRDFYFNQFLLSPTASNDRMDVRKLENRFFIKLQPFAPDAVISKINAGIGYQILSTYSFRPMDYLTGYKYDTQHNLFLYGGASGMFRKYIEWEADGDYYYAGYRMFDFDLGGKIKLSLYPNEGGIHLTGKFNTSLKEPHPFEQYIYTNHHHWENDYDKISDTRIEGNLSIPDWKTDISAGYALVDNMIYYDTLSVIRQHDKPVNVLSASVENEFRIWMLHFDNRVLYQVSSDQQVLPLPKLALNLKYFIEFNVVKDVMRMQLGLNATFTTKYYMQAYAPDTGVFYNQERELIGSVPYFDAFANIQWKTASLFVKYTNCFKDWPSSDYFSAYRYIRPCEGFKFGILWPFYIK